VTIIENFNNYGTSDTNVAGLGSAGGEFTGAWAGSNNPDYAPGQNLNYFAPGYNNTGNETGPEDGAARQGGDPNVGNGAYRTLAGSGLTGTIWASALARVDGIGRVSFRFDDPRVVGPIYAQLRGTGDGMVSASITYDNLTITDTSSPDRFLASETHLMLIRLGIDPVTTTFALWVNPDLSGGEAGLSTPLYNVSAPTNDMIGPTLQDVGVGFFGTGETSLRLLDAIRLSNDIDGFIQVTALPEPRGVFLAAQAILLVVSGRRYNIFLRRRSGR
jgi:hypothetical protein